MHKNALKKMGQLNAMQLGRLICLQRAALQHGKRKGKAQWLLQFTKHKINYVKAFKSGSTEQAGLHPTVPAYKEQVCFV